MDSGSRARAASSSAVIFQPVVKRTVRRLVFRSRRCSCRTWVAPAPSPLTRIFAVEAPVTREGASARTRRWSLVVLEPALPGRSSMARHSEVFAHQAASGWNPKVFFQVALAPYFLDAAVMTVASMSITIQRCRRLPATVSQRKPPGRRFSCARTWRRIRARTLAIRASTGSSSAARVRRIVESEAPGPNSRVVGMQLPGLQQVPRSEHDRDRELHDDLGPVPPSGARTAWHRRGQCARQTGAVRELAQQHRPGVPDQPLPVGVDDQATVPPCTLAHQEGALTLVPDTT